MTEIPAGFLNEEIRCDYTVSAHMKKVWAIQMDLLNELDRVCTKYGIRYYANFGTLIGAVRHKGYIPWDDDIDVVMFREDYQKLAEVASEEFSHPYFLQDAYTDGFLRGFARLRNSGTAALTERYLDRDINQGIFIDIFFIDNVPDQPLVRKLWMAETRFARQLTNAVFFDNPTQTISIQKKVALKVMKTFYTTETLAKAFDRLCSRYNRKKTECVGCVAFAPGSEKYIWKREWFEKSHYVPYEYMQINIPDGYDLLLTHIYKDYMVMKKNPTSHGTVLFVTDTSYRDYMRQHPVEEIRKMISEL